MEPFILLFVGLLLIYFEFFLPGGILGVLGAIALIASVVLFVLAYNSPLPILVYVVSVAFAIGFVVKLAIWRVQHSDPGYSVYSDDAQEGYTASQYDKTAVGKEGVVITELRPGGHIEVAGVRYHAISRSGYITKGERVLVVGGEGETLIVKHAKKE